MVSRNMGEQPPRMTFRDRPREPMDSDEMNGGGGMNGNGSSMMDEATRQESGPSEFMSEANRDPGMSMMEGASREHSQEDYAFQEAAGEGSMSSNPLDLDDPFSDPNYTESPMERELGSMFQDENGGGGGAMTIDDLAREEDSMHGDPFDPGNDSMPGDMDSSRDIFEEFDSAHRAEMGGMDPLEAELSGGDMREDALMDSVSGADERNPFDELLDEQEGNGNGMIFDDNGSGYNDSMMNGNNNGSMDYDSPLAEAASEYKENNMMQKSEYNGNGMDKSMEYKGMGRDPSYGPRRGRGSMRM